MHKSEYQYCDNYNSDKTFLDYRYEVFQIRYEQVYTYYISILQRQVTVF